MPGSLSIMKKKNTLKANQKLVKPSQANVPNDPLSNIPVEEFARFYEYHPAKRLSRNLRSLLLEFMMYDGSLEAEYLRELAIDLDGLFTLLDAMEDGRHDASRDS